VIFENSYFRKIFIAIIHDKNSVRISKMRVTFESNFLLEKDKYSDIVNRRSYVLNKVLKGDLQKNTRNEIYIV